VAGVGTRLRPHSYTQPKALMPIAGKTVLSIIIEQVLEAGADEFIFVVGYLGDKIRDYVEEKYPHIKAHYVYQVNRQGVGHAIQMAKDICQNDELLVMLGDTICEFDIKEFVSYPESTLGIRRVEDPREFGVVEIDEDGYIFQMVEKPAIPKSNIALVGVYKVVESNMLFECLEQNYAQKLQAHGEYSLTDALMCMLKKGVKFKPYLVDNWFDCGRNDSMLESNATLLKKFNGMDAPENNYENTVLVPPVSIAPGCKIKNSIIGPNVSIGDNTVLSYSIIRNSIIGAYSILDDIVLENSIIGSDAALKGESRRLNIGDNTKIDLG